MDNRIRRLPIWIAIFLGVSMGTLEAATYRAYVGNSRGDDITVIDIGTRNVVADIKVGKIVHGICAPADGRTVFTTIESEKAFKIVDTATNKVIDTILLPGLPNECTSTPDGRFAAVPIRAVAGSIVIIDVPRRQIVKVLPINLPHNCYNSGDNNLIYCEARGEQQQIESIDLRTLDYTHATPVGGDPRPFAVTKDGNNVYVAVTEFHGFADVDIAHNDAIHRVELPAGPPPPSQCEEFEPRTPTHGLDLTPDGKELWVTSLADAKVYVYEMASKKISSGISTGSCPNWISFSPDGTYAVVSNSASNDVSIIETMRRNEVARIKVGNVPKRLVAIKMSESAAGARVIPPSTANR